MALVGEAVREHRSKTGAPEHDAVILGIASWDAVDNKQSLEPTKEEVIKELCVDLLYLFVCLFVHLSEITYPEAFLLALNEGAKVNTLLYRVAKPC